ncbi:unnamed protein product [Microthlaspi erraticum]|uniref:Uncharacterized protein n=1 Tax=Microthlaspi erraticum TaxID=1685480 RepID=A0A6D2HRW0_9BRAS|nr:unnamed protein product [Microthlaspi erraticum]
MASNAPSADPFAASSAAVASPASNAFSTAVATPTFKILEQIEGQFCNDPVLVRLIHFWEARNFKKGNILMGFELLLLDPEVICAPSIFKYTVV